VNPGAFLLRSCTATADRPARCLFLLTAVLAVGVPSCLVAGCGGGQQGPDPGPAGPAVSAGPVRQGSAAALRKRSSPLAANLLDKAAQAVVLRSYQGQELVSRWDVSGAFEMANVCHVSGGDTIVAAQAAAGGLGSQPFASADLDNESPEGVLDVTLPLVSLLKEHYIVQYRGISSADNRSVRVVEAWRTDGSLAARFLLDTATGLPLEREVFDPAAHVISQGAFINVQLGTATPGTSAAACAAPAVARAAAEPLATKQQASVPQASAGQAQQTSALTPDQLMARRDQGWQVPAALPGGLTLFTGYQTITPSGPVLDLGYSDGIYVVSLFEQRGKLAAALTGWQPSKVGGRVVYAAEPSQRLVAWPGHGLVYTVVADAPPQTLAAVVRGLPYDAPPGFWKRISRGLTRLVRLANPFG
jgi:sigma-E factor negative regulatory protein RseB